MSCNLAVYNLMHYELQWTMQQPSSKASSLSAGFCVADISDPNPFITVIRVKTTWLLDVTV
jgi:hypothetical protein